MDLASGRRRVGRSTESDDHPCVQGDPAAGEFASALVTGDKKVGVPDKKVYGIGHAVTLTLRPVRPISPPCLI